MVEGLQVLDRAGFLSFRSRRRGMAAFTERPLEGAT